MVVVDDTGAEDFLVVVVGVELVQSNPLAAEIACRNQLEIGFHKQAACQS